MSYVSGTALGTSELFDALNTFLDDEGWTVERYTGGATEITRTVTRGGGDHHRGFGISTNFSSDPWGGPQGPALLCVPWESWTDEGGYVWYTQGGHPRTSDSSRILGVGCARAETNIPYHFFSSADGEQVVVVVGRTTGVFNYLGFGFLTEADKFGTWDGWQYTFSARGLLTSSSQIWYNPFNQHYDSLNLPPLPPGAMVDTSMTAANALIQVDSDSSGLEWRGMGLPHSSTNARTTRVLGGWFSRASGVSDINIPGVGGLPETKHLWVRSRSGLASNMVVSPCIISAYRNSTERWSPLCRLPLVHSCFTSGAINEGAQFSIGGDDYRAFNSYAVREIAGA